MLDRLLNGITDTISDTLSDGVNRLLDRELRIGVTGLSRGGKTAFITSLVNTVLSFGTEGAQSRMGRFRGYTEAGIGYGGIVQNHNLTVPRFPYEACYDALTARPPRWPVPTESVSEIRLEVRCRDSRFYMPGRTRTLYLDLFDYPGEWLIDLVLLGRSYEEFSALVREEAQRLTEAVEGTAALMAQCRALDPLAPPDVRALHAVVESYVAWQRRCKEIGIAMVVPGRFVLPGELQGAPVIEFVPWLGDPPRDPPRGSLYQVMRQRYESFRTEVVERFYREVFSGLDRQVILIDCFKALRGGKESFRGVNDTFAALLGNFSYGDSNFLLRLFAPRIDKVIFAATKADLVTYDELPHLLELLRSMVTSAAREVRGGGSNCQFMTLSSISATTCHEITHQGRRAQVLRTANRADGSFYPGTMPSKWSVEAMDFFREHFLLRQGLPPLPVEEGGPVPSLGMDLMLSYLLEDKL
ncbi:MAG: YcjX family protein [Succinivibrionaceae bacterium]|nr:YcjX family protein [Succinivibrionaceae bacterium]